MLESIAVVAGNRRRGDHSFFSLEVRCMHRKLAACLMAANMAAMPVLAQEQAGDLEAL